MTEFREKNPLNDAKKTVNTAKLATSKQFNILDFCDHVIDFLNNPNIYDAKLIIKSLKRLKK